MGSKKEENLQLLIVEDEFILQEKLKDMLLNMGYKKLHVAQNVDEVEKCVAIHKIDLALMDLNLHGEFLGVDIAESIKQNHDIPSIFISSYDEQDVVDKAKKVNPFGYILKPVRERELKLALEMATYRLRFDESRYLAKQLNQEKAKAESLLAITEAIANINTGPELVRAIFNQVRKVFPFDEAGLFHLDFENQLERDLIVDYSYNTSDANEILKEKGVYGWLPLSSISKYIIQNKTLHIEVEDMYREFRHPHFELVKDLGFKKMIASRLSIGDEIVGFLAFWSKEFNEFEVKEEIFESLTNHLSIALNNIIVHEKLLEEKAKAESLLVITEAIANINTGPELVNAIFNHLQKVFPFDEAGLFHLDFENDMERDLIVDYGYDTSVVSEELKNAGLFSWMPMTALSKYLVENKYLQMSISEIYEKFKHPHFQFTGLLDFNEVMACSLESGGNTIGLLYFWSKKKNAFDNKKPLFESIAKHLNVALNNIITNETLKEEKTFKETLLEISEAATKIRNREQFGGIMLNTLKPIIHFDDVVLVYFSDNLKSFNILFTGAETARQEHQYYEKVTQQTFPVQGTPMEDLMKGEKLQFLETALTLEEYPKDPGLSLMMETDLNHSAAIKLYNRNELLGVLFFHFSSLDKMKQHKNELYLNIADQLSIAVANVLANEELLEKQKQKEEQLKLNRSLIKAKDFNSLLREIASTLNYRLSFDHFSVRVFDNERIYHHYLMKKDEQGNFFDLGKGLATKSHQVKIDDHAELMNSSTLPRILVGKTFDKVLETSQMNRRRNKYAGVRSVLEYPLEFSNGSKVLLTVSSTIEDAFSLESLKVFETYVAPIALGIQNLLAFEQIKKLKEDAEQVKDYLREEVDVHYNFGTIVGESNVLKKILMEISEVANTDSTVLITGETGTGKELVARAIHNASSRRDKTLIKINCAALPAQLLESELFGHEKGSFTGATHQRIGKFEVANNSTLFLDEIGELPMELQAKLLRVIQEKEFERIGSNKVIKTNARIIVATNRNLEQEIKEGNFRADLFYRLNVFPIKVPSLRERKEDLEHLANHFIKQKNINLGKNIKGLSEATLKEFTGYDWPGNVREMEHLIERAMISSKSPKLAIKIPKILDSDAETSSVYSPKSYKESEQEIILNALRYCGGRVRGEGGTAEMLELPPSTLESKMKRLGIKRKHIVLDNNTDYNY